MNKFKHLTTGMIAYADGNFSRLDVDYPFLRIEGNAAAIIPYKIITEGKDWEEIKSKALPYPIGTRIRNIKFNVIIKKIESTQWRAETGTSFFDFDESLIGIEYTLISVPDQEDIPPKEFTILAFKHLLYPSNPREILYADSQLKDTFCRENGKQPFFTLAWCLQTEFPIHSFRRESDGKIFTVGNTLHVSNTVAVMSSNPITEIIMYNNEPLVRTKYGGYPYKVIH